MQGARVGTPLRTAAQVWPVVTVKVCDVPVEVLACTSRPRVVSTSPTFRTYKRVQSELFVAACNPFLHLWGYIWAIRACSLRSAPSTRRAMSMDDCGSLATLHPSETEYSMRSITLFCR